MDDVKALPALLALLALAPEAFAAPEPAAPQTLPIIYEQPGDRYILRIDNRRYQLPVLTKGPVSQLMASANYPRTKLLYDEFKRALEDKEKAEATIRRAQANADREEERAQRIRRTLDGLQTQLTLLRSQPVVDLRDILFLQDQIRAATASLASAEAQEAKARVSLDRTQGAAEATLMRADKARDAYAAALTAYEKPLAEIRSIAITHGTAL
jgi:hypothetical protein